VDDVDRRIVQERLEIVVDGRATRRNLVRAGLIRVHDGDHSAVGQVTEGVHAERAESARADQPDAERAGHPPSCSVSSIDGLAGSLPKARSRSVTAWLATSPTRAIRKKASGRMRTALIATSATMSRASERA
jgi:hypothetical protein